MNKFEHVKSEPPDYDDNERSKNNKLQHHQNPPRRLLPHHLHSNHYNKISGQPPKQYLFDTTFTLV